MFSVCREASKITLAPKEIGIVPTGKRLLHIEGAEPILVSTIRRDDKRSIKVQMAAYGAAWTMGYKGI